MKLYLGTFEDEREFGDDEVIRIAPKAAGIGKAPSHLEKDRSYSTTVCDGLKATTRKFFYCEKTNHESFASQEEALAAATAFFEANNKNTRDTVIEIRVRDLTDKVCKAFGFVEGIQEHDEMPVPIDPYLLGLWLNNPRSSKDGFGALAPEVAAHVGDRTIPEDQLQGLGLLASRHIPESYMANSIRIRSLLMAGLMDANCMWIANNTFNLTQKTRQMAQDAARLTTSLGFFNHMEEVEAGVRWMVYVYFNPFASKIPALVPANQWSTNGSTVRLTRILLNPSNTQRNTDWTPQLNAELMEATKKHTLQDGQVDWQGIIDHEPQFAKISRSRLCARYQVIRMTSFGGTATTGDQTIEDDTTSKISLYLGGYSEPRLFEPNEVISVAPGYKAVGKTPYDRPDREAYYAKAAYGFTEEAQFFYYRKVHLLKGGNSSIYASKAEAWAAINAWYDKTNTNTRTTILEIAAKDITEDVCARFGFVEPFVDYPEAPVPIDPYVLGLWLGDGTSLHAGITTIDAEIMDYIETYAASIGCTTRRHTKRSTDAISINVAGAPNPFLDGLKQLNLIGNKHIPELYMKNSKDIRLKVLAGIIDTDGTLSSNNTFDVTQKNAILARDCVSLARSLGIYAYMATRTARATNGRMDEAKEYARVYMHMSPLTPIIPVILERKRWDPKDQANIHGIAISLAPPATVSATGSKRHNWTPELDAKLRNAANSKTNQFSTGRIKWANIIKKDAELAVFSKDSLRVRFRTLSLAEAPGASTSEGAA